jgi:hypothetical protein
MKKVVALITFIFSFMLISGVNNAYAIDCTLSDPPHPSQMLCPFLRIFNVVLIAGGVVLLIFIVVGAVKMATALGDPKGLSSARDTWLYAVIGVFIVAGVYAIFRILNTTFGLGLDAYLGAGGVNAIFDRINNVWLTLLEDVLHVYE